jgi:hypothetical protein
MTVEVEVDGKMHTGSSVIEVQLETQPQFLPGVGLVVQKVSGEAVFVDLGEGRNVVALLASGPRGQGVNFPASAVPEHYRLSYTDEDLVKFPHLTGRWQLDPQAPPESSVPTLVTLGDLNDPTTAKIVRPDEFPQVFGADVKPPTITIEMTRDRVTRAIEKKLPWLTHVEDYRTVRNNPFTNTLRFGRPSFTRGG